jgi:hypothetical protein
MIISDSQLMPSSTPNPSVALLDLHTIKQLSKISPNLLNMPGSICNIEQLHLFGYFLFGHGDPQVHLIREEQYWKASLFNG